MTNSLENKPPNQNTNPLHLFNDNWARDNLGEDRDRLKKKKVKKERGKITNVLSAISGLLG